MGGYVFAKPGMPPKEIVKAVRSLKGVCLTSTGMRDAGQSDFKNLLLGSYGRLPMEWPAEWVYKSAFGDEWKAKIKERVKTSPLDMLEDEDLEKIRRDLSAAINREPSEEKIILIRMAKGLGDVAAPINGNVWRIGNPERGSLSGGSETLDGNVHHAASVGT